VSWVCKFTWLEFALAPAAVRVRDDRIVATRWSAPHRCNCWWSAVLPESMARARK